MRLQIQIWKLFKNTIFYFSQLHLMYEFFIFPILKQPL